MDRWSRRRNHLHPSREPSFLFIIRSHPSRTNHRQSLQPQWMTDDTVIYSRNSDCIFNSIYAGKGHPIPKRNGERDNLMLYIIRTVNDFSMYPMAFSAGLQPSLTRGKSSTKWICKNQHDQKKLFNQETKNEISR